MLDKRSGNETKLAQTQRCYSRILRHSAQQQALESRSYRLVRADHMTQQADHMTQRADHMTQRADHLTR